MTGSGTGSQHPELRQYDQLAWAVWIRDGHEEDCQCVVAESEAKAREKAIERSDVEPNDVHIDGPFGDAEPAYFEFEFVTEHRETIVVEAPTEKYAKETARAERTHKGEYVQTIHTESRRIPKDGDSSE